MKVQDADGVTKPIIDLVEFDEVYDSELVKILHIPSSLDDCAAFEADKVTHFQKIREYSQIDYAEMVISFLPHFPSDRKRRRWYHRHTIHTPTHPSSFSSPSPKL